MMYCFGHIHEGNGFKQIDWTSQNDGVIDATTEGSKVNPYPQPLQWKHSHRELTLAVNAAIMTGKNKPENAPWLISPYLAV